MKFRGELITLFGTHSLGECNAKSEALALYHFQCCLTQSRWRKRLGVPMAGEVRVYALRSPPAARPKRSKGGEA